MMAQMSPRKLPRGKATSYSVISLSDQKLVEPLLSGLSIAACNPSVETDVTPVPVPQAHAGNAEDVDKLFTVSTRMSCNCCDIVFSNRTEQKAHFKSDWHRYNLKQQLKGDKSVTEDQFETITGEVSSISGSDSTSSSSSDEDVASVKPSPTPAHQKHHSHVYDGADASDSDSEDVAAVMAAARRHPKVFLKNQSGQLLSLYRCVLYHKKNSPSTPAELMSLAKQAKTYTRVAVVMLAGGHFSAAIFDGVEVVVHKTFHRYVVRAKRGTVQSVRDSQGAAPKSGGASLRRYNEAALALEIQELLTSWSQQLKACHLIFLRTSTYSQRIFFGGKSPALSKGDDRIRTIPFVTGRPTFNEAKRVHRMLMAVECFGDESLVTDFVPVSPPRRLHPDTGQLVVRPDAMQSLPPRNNKVKKKTDQGDKMEKRAETVVTEMAQETVESEQTADVDADKPSEGETEVELVEVVEEMSTEHLQEFACSVVMPKQNKKTKKKKGAQRSAGGEATPVQPNHTDAPQLSEEDMQLKNRLYTCCRSGDVTLLSQLLEQVGTRDLSQPSSLGANAEGTAWGTTLSRVASDSIAEIDTSPCVTSDSTAETDTSPRVTSDSTAETDTSPCITGDSAAETNTSAHFKSDGRFETNTPAHFTNDSCVETDAPTHRPNDGSFETNTLTCCTNDGSFETNTPTHFAGDCIESNTPSHVAHSGSAETNAPQHIRNSSSSEANCTGHVGSELPALGDNNACSQIASNETQGVSQISTGDTHMRCRSDVFHTDAPVPQQSNSSCGNRTRTARPESGTVMTQSAEGCGEGDGGAESSTSPIWEQGARFQQLVLGSYGQREFSLLHVAASAGHSGIITALLEAGCDPTLRDGSGKTAYNIAVTKDSRNAFRRFRGKHPDRYDYNAAQIPSALTADFEVERKQREAEKKKAQKKAKQERLKERKAEEAKAAAEQREKDRFLGLSDREKRALAAEKRLLEQSSTQRGAFPVLNRCFQCGLDISGKVPFEYMDFQFCKPKCLQEHRIKHAK